MTIALRPIVYSLAIAITISAAAAASQSPRQKRPAQSRAPQRQAPHIAVVNLPAGSFTMGSDSEPDEKPAHRVEITAPFAIGKYEVTQTQWNAVMASNPSQFSGTELPVERVTWAEAQAFVERLSAMSGKRYRLPTEAEWEYACRAGEAGPWGHGNSERVLARYA